MTVQTLQHATDRTETVLGCLFAVRRYSKHRGSTRSVLVALASYADPDGTNARPSIAQLAQAAGVAESTARAALRRLEADGTVSTQRGGGRKASRYTVNVLALSPTVHKPVHELAGRQGTDSRRAPHRKPSGTPPNPGPYRPSTDHDRGPRCDRHASAVAPVPCLACRDARLDHERRAAAVRDAVERAHSARVLRTPVAAVPPTAAFLAARRSATPAVRL